MKRYWRQTNMKLNKKQQESIIDSLDINEAGRTGSIYFEEESS